MDIYEEGKVQKSEIFFLQVTDREKKYMNQTYRPYCGLSINVNKSEI